MAEYSWHRQTIYETLTLIQRNSEHPWVAIGDFLDDWNRTVNEDRVQLVNMDIPHVGGILKPIGGQCFARQW